MIKRIMILCAACLLSFNVNAYSINYADNSPIKDVPLKNATLKLKVYYNGNPRGFMDVTTDENQKFDLKDFKDTSAVSLEILSISDQDKYNARCKNTVASENKEDMLIRCVKSKKA